MKKLVTVIAGRPVISAVLYSILFVFSVIGAVISSAVFGRIQNDVAEVIAAGIFFVGFATFGLLPATIIRFLFYKKLLENVVVKNGAVIGFALIEALMFFATLMVARDAMITTDGAISLFGLGGLYILQMMGAGVILGVVSTAFSKTVQRTMEGFRKA